MGKEIVTKKTTPGEEVANKQTNYEKFYTPATPTTSISCKEVMVAESKKGVPAASIAVIVRL